MTILLLVYVLHVVCSYFLAGIALLLKSKAYFPGIHTFSSIFKMNDVKSIMRERY